MHSPMGSHGKPGFAPNSSVIAGNSKEQVWLEGPNGETCSEMAGRI